MAETSQTAAMLLSFERRMRSCTSNREVSFRAVNETAGIMRHSQAILWRVDAFSRPMVVAASGLADIAVDSPYQQWLDRKSTRLNSSHLKLSRMPSSA